MDEAWFSGLSDELAEAIVDARACALACEELLGASRTALDPERRQRLLRAVVAPAAISRILIDLLDRPEPLVLAAAKICRESSLHAAEELAALTLPLETGPVVAALRQAADSCGRLLAAADVS